MKKIIFIIAIIIAVIFITRLSIDFDTKNSYVSKGDFVDYTVEFNMKIGRIQSDLDSLKRDLDSVKQNLDSVKHSLDTLKRGQVIIYDEVKKNPKSLIEMIWN